MKEKTMSNLGWYQTITTVSKKVGGPRNLLLLTAASGYAVLRTGEASVKKIYKTVKNLNTKKKRNESTVYDVTANGKTVEDLEFNIGEQYRILESDGDSILIEKIGDSNNPYFVSADFLSSVSDFTN